MLKQKYTEGDIIAFRLVTGEEILGKVKESDESTLTVDNPRTFAPDGQGNVNLVPITFMGDQSKPVVFHKDAIVARITPREDFVNGYRSATSGIATATEADLAALNKGK